jgi:hypothetical protein
MRTILLYSSGFSITAFGAFAKNSRHYPKEKRALSTGKLTLFQWKDPTFLFETGMLFALRILPFIT